MERFASGSGHSQQPLERSRCTIRRRNRLYRRRGVEQDHPGQFIYLVDWLLREYCGNPDANTNTNTNSNSDTDTDTDSDSNANANFAA